MKVNPRKNEDCESDFSIELTNKHRLSIISTDDKGGAVIEGTLGKLQRVSFVEPEILEVKGTFGVLRLHLRSDEITVNKNKGDENV